MLLDESARPTKAVTRTTRTRRAIVVAGLALAATLVSTREASAFCRSTSCRSTSSKECERDDNGCPAEGAPLFWPTSCIAFATNEVGTIDLDPEDTRRIIRKTFQAWSDVQCKDGGTASMTFQEMDPVPCKKSEYNKDGPNVNVVLFQDDDWRYRGIDGTLAKTSVTYNDETGEIYDADIEVNTAFNEVTITDNPAEIQYDLQAILTHEVGHFIGLAHSEQDTAVMYESYTPGSTSQRTLTVDDVAAVCAAYPPNNGVACNAEPRGGFSPTCDEPESAGGCSTASTGRGDAASALTLSGLAIFVAACISRKAVRVRRVR